MFGLGKVLYLYRYFLLYYIGFNGLPRFAAAERLCTLGGKIFAPPLTRPRHFEIIMLFGASKW